MCLPLPLPHPARLLRRAEGRGGESVAAEPQEEASQGLIGRVFEGVGAALSGVGSELTWVARGPSAEADLLLSRSPISLSRSLARSLSCALSRAPSFSLSFFPSSLCPCVGSWRGLFFRGVDVPLFSAGVVGVMGAREMEGAAERPPDRQTDGAPQDPTGPRQGGREGEEVLVQLRRPESITGSINIARRTRARGTRARGRPAMGTILHARSSVMEAIYQGLSEGCRCWQRCRAARSRPALLCGGSEGLQRRSCEIR